METNKQAKRGHMNSIRSKLKTLPIFSANTLKIAHQNDILNTSETAPNSPTKDASPTTLPTEETVSAHPVVHNCIKTLNQKYEFLDKIGEGSNGMVRKCVERQTGKLYAVKISSIDQEHILHLKKMFKAVKALNHPAIIKYKEMYIETKKRICYLIMDYMPYSSLRKYKPLPEPEIKSIIKQLLDALAYLHSHRLCHRDIKSDNILYDPEKSKIYIIDFGISKKTVERGKRKELWTPTGTLDYQAPEMLCGGGYNELVDVWAVGIILYELITCYLPFHSEYLSETIQKITNLDLTFEHLDWDHVSKLAKDLCSRLLKDKRSRLTASEALKAPWFLEEKKQDIGFSIIPISTFDRLQRKQTLYQQFASHRHYDDPEEYDLGQEGRTSTGEFGTFDMQDINIERMLSMNEAGLKALEKSIEQMRKLDNEDDDIKIS